MPLGFDVNVIVISCYHYFHPNCLFIGLGQSSFALYFKRCTEKQIEVINDMYS